MEEEQYWINQRIIQNKTKQWDEEVLAVLCCTVKIAGAQRVHRTV